MKGKKPVEREFTIRDKDGKEICKVTAKNAKEAIGKYVEAKYKGKEKQ